MAAISLLNYQQISHISEASDSLDYYAFMIKRNQQAGILDPYALMQLWQLDAHVCDLANIPTIKQVLTWKKHSTNLIEIDDRNRDDSSLGVITKVDEKTVTQKIADEYQFNREDTFFFDDICLIDLCSRDLLQMQLYLSSKRK
ncbi:MULTISPECIES: hypothetical protein [Lactobacillus]|uniref:Uncharacterized protein n=1 Tax=Lactobacillus xujianguonis TaxID=2495899 RepID=A0A437SX33_9LACO|nr:MULTISPECIES: hypothetical protein [Lactobacillus]RVU71471.1 hypothetical protein EJK17_01860 [Lactobacillus xujianguonis]RVU73694.1 hypothetical protein EJK20_06910 [Lactobacillus xujianguonis]